MYPSAEAVHPNRSDIQEPASPNTGMDHSPSRYDFDRKKKIDEATRGAQQVEDRQSTEYWKEKKREQEANARYEREAAAQRERDKQKRGRKRKIKAGVEMPKAGFNRLGNAHKGLGSVGSGDDGGYGISGGGAIGYSDPFGGMSAGFSRAGRGTGMAFSVGGFSEMMGGRGRDTGTYQDPFASLTPGKRGRKPKDTYQSPFGGMMLSMNRGRGRPPKSIFGSRLSLEMF